MYIYIHMQIYVFINKRFYQPLLVSEPLTVTMSPHSIVTPHHHNLWKQSRSKMKQQMLIEYNRIFIKSSKTLNSQVYGQVQTQYEIQANLNIQLSSLRAKNAGKILPHAVCLDLNIPRLPLPTCYCCILFLLLIITFCCTFVVKKTGSKSQTF